MCVFVLLHTAWLGHTSSCLLPPRLPWLKQEMYAFTLSCYKAGIRGIDLHLKVTAVWGWAEVMAV